MKRHSLVLVATALLLPFLLALSGCTGCTSCTVSYSWPQFRGDQFRDGLSFVETVLNDPNNVSTLHVAWTSPRPQGVISYHASPIISNGKVYIGNGNGYFYCFDANSGNLLWQYPAQGHPLDSQFHINPSSYGIADSGAITNIGGVTAVVFGAADPYTPNPNTNTTFGDGHIFALNADTGALIWESPVVAQLTGLTSGSTTELHEQIGYSAPLVFNDRVYVGIADHGDNPIQRGKVISVKLAGGSIDNNFSFLATGGAGTRGGGVWGSLAAWDDIYATTGNTRFANDPEPNPNYGLSLLRMNKDTGAVVWQHQPVPFALDDDPDWAAGPSVMYSADCGPAIVSTQKDGWTWAVQAGTTTAAPPGVMWAFPPGPWSGGHFSQGDGTVHGDKHYKRPGATWGHVYISRMGGFDTISDLTGGYTRLTALNVCSSDSQRVRWIKNVPGTDGTQDDSFHYSLGPPTVTTAGMIFVGTNLGHLVAIADPSVHPALGTICEDPDIPPNLCVGMGHRLVPDPWVVDIPLPGGASDYVYGEPAIAGGRIFVATDAGNLYMLQP